MTDTAIAIAAASFVASAVASCWIAAACRGSGYDSGWAWGLLGPVGWIIAALRGIQDAIRETHAPRRD